MNHSEYKSRARQHQIDFKVSNPEIGVDRNLYPTRAMRRNNKTYIIDVESSLRPEDCRDENGNYRIFFSGFREEITREIDRTESISKRQMVTNLLRSEHIPYNVFFPMRKDMAGATRLFNKILGGDRIATIDEILIEYNPGGLHDGTSFDVYVRYTPKNCENNKTGGIGIEVKYTEKEYPATRDSKEWKETHDGSGIHLNDNYRNPSYNCGWFKEEYIRDTPYYNVQDSDAHVVANRYRQIWRNHLLGASMILGLSPDPKDKLTEFTSLTVYPRDNGHFDNIWTEYESKLTPAGLSTFRHITYEELFPIMRECFDPALIPNLDKWLDYLQERYYI